MGKYFSALFACFAMTTLLHAENEMAAPSEEEILLIDFVDIREARAEELLNIMEGKVENLALHFPQGATLPVKPKLSGEFLELSEGEVVLSVEIKKDFYVRPYEGSILVSSDLRSWKDLGQFVTGSIHLGLVKEELDPILATLEARLNERK